jgi:hypothetical protein
MLELYLNSDDTAMNSADPELVTVRPRHSSVQFLDFFKPSPQWFPQGLLVTQFSLDRKTCKALLCNALLLLSNFS